MIKRSLFFLYDRLQITAAERKLIYIFSGILIILTVSQPFVQPLIAIDESNYEPVIQVFEERLTKLQKSQELQLSQYYPESTPNTGTKVEAEAFTEEPSNEIPIQNTDVKNKQDSQKSSTTEVSVDDELININTADAKELTKLPGVGPAIAARIIEYREEYGPFKNIEDIKKVRGIGPVRFDAMKELITVTTDK